MNELEIRTAQVASVSFPERIVELIVMPYETETNVVHRGKLITEICSRGAYAGIECRNGQVRVNRDHDVQRTCGRAIRLHPSRHEGLVAEVRLSKTDLGEETLVLADDGILDASAGFMLHRNRLPDGTLGPVVPNAEVWESRSRRRLNHLFLGHIALTPEPAYETARVLSVRHQDTPAVVVVRPNFARLDLLIAKEEADVLNARYSS
jgi:hypothetical protein